MKPITLTEFGAPPALRDDLPAPAPGAGEVLMRVHALLGQPHRQRHRGRDAQGHVPHEFPITLRRDRNCPRMAG